MASSAAFANSLLSLKSHRPNALPSSTCVAIPKSNNLSLQFKDNSRKNQLQQHARFTTFCSVEAAKDAAQDTPIEQSKHQFFFFCEFHFFFNFVKCFC